MMCQGAQDIVKGQAMLIAAFGNDVEIVYVLTTTPLRMTIPP